MPASSRHEVVEAARRLYAGSRQPTVDDIAVAAGISRATLYRLIGSRSALLEDLQLGSLPSVRARVLDAAGRLVE
jgi:AcrR family transcriptional regulator